MSGKSPIPGLGYFLRLWKISVNVGSKMAELKGNL